MFVPGDVKLGGMASKTFAGNILAVHLDPNDIGLFPSPRTGTPIGR